MAAGACPSRFARSRSIWSRYPLPASSCRIRRDARGAQPARHLVPVGIRQLPHRAIELELLDRSQREHLLALQRDAGPLADHRRANRLPARPAAAASRSTPSPTSAVGAHQHGQQDRPPRCPARGWQTAPPSHSRARRGRRTATAGGCCCRAVRLHARRASEFGGAEALRAEADSRTVSVEVSELIVESFFEGRIGRR